MQVELKTSDRPQAEFGKANQAELIVNNGPKTGPAVSVSSETGLACLFRMGV